MTRFLDGEFESTGQKWRDDPANTTADRLLAELSEELGTDGPAETFGHGDAHGVGRLVEDDAGTGADVTREAVAHDSHDEEDLSAEEAAIHLVGDSVDETDDPDLTPEVIEELRQF